MQGGNGYTAEPKFGDFTTLNSGIFEIFIKIFP